MAEQVQSPVSEPARQRAHGIVDIDIRMADRREYGHFPCGITEHLS